MQLLKKISGWLVIILVPVILVLAAVRILLSPVYLNLEYRLPYFPQDRYGFSQADRLDWADLSRVYLLNSAGIEFLADLRFPDGQQAAGDCAEFLAPRDCSYFYNDRELKHMLDVKRVVQSALWSLGLAALVVVGMGIWAYRSNWWAAYRRSLLHGGQATLGLIAIVLAYLVFNFNSLFVNFHRIFFEGDTWLFQFSDSLIRLFPVEFWRDAFIWVGLLSAAGAALLIYWMHRPTGFTRIERLTSARRPTSAERPKSPRKPAVTKPAKNKRRRRR